MVRESFRPPAGPTVADRERIAGHFLLALVGLLGTRHGLGNSLPVTVNLPVLPFKYPPTNVPEPTSVTLPSVETVPLRVKVRSDGRASDAVLGFDSRLCWK